MPIYAFKCPYCDCCYESFQAAPSEECECPMCSEIGQRDYMQEKAGPPPFKAYVCHDFPGPPVEITDRTQERKLAKKTGLERIR